MSGFQFCPINYDMTCGLLPNYFNLQANMYMADSLARANLYNVPIMNFGTFMSYGGASIPGEMIFNYTLTQAHHQSLANGGAGIFNSDGSLNLTGNIFGGYGYGSRLGTSYNPFGGLGITPWATPFAPGSSSSSSSSSKKTEEEREAEEKMKEDSKVIKAVLEAYRKANADYIDKDLDRKLKNAIDKTGTAEEKYNALKDAYEAIDKDSLRKVFPTMDDYRENLINVGFDFTDDNYTLGYGKKEREEEINNLKAQFDSIYQELSAYTPGDVDFNLEGYLDKFNESHAADILSYLSLWNEKYNDKDEKLLNLVISKLPTTDNNTSEGEKTGKRSRAIELAVNPVVNALVAKANNVVNSPKGVDVKPIARQAQTLNRALANFANDSKNEEKIATLVAEFDTLYVMLRKYEAYQVDREIASDYEILNELNEKDQIALNNKMMEATVADLESEGLGGIEFEIRAVSNSNSGVKFSAKEEIENLAADGYAVEEIEIEGNTYYVELLRTGDRENRRVFAVVGEDIKVIGEFDEENKVVIEYPDADVKKVTVRSIEKDYENAIDKKEEKEGASDKGKKVMKALSDGDATEEVYSAFKNVSSNNILETLDGIYGFKEGNEWWRERGFFSRGNSSGAINVDTGKKIIKAVLDKAAKYEGFTDKEAYKELADIYENYEKGDCSEAEDFSKIRWGHLVSDFFRSTSIGTLFDDKMGARIKGTDAGIIDDCIEALYKDIKKAEAKGVNENA